MADEEQKRDKALKEHTKKFTHVMNELTCVYDLNWTWWLFPSHVLLLLQQYKSNQPSS